MSFESLGLCDELLSAIAAQGYTTPTPIQIQAIPVVFEGCDLLAGAQTGTGKTAAFALPIVQMLSETVLPSKRRSPRALVLVPTRELAAQVSGQMQNYGRRLSLRSTMIYGGVNIQAQIERLHRGVDIVVATPGRLLDHA
ncbi:MAG: DEAD/DEAH box helicase, partial [Desulfuromonadales bacterium]|nr:DEAD/DEAH box helicase [Desulfuromonadales bacterium]